MLKRNNKIMSEEAAANKFPIILAHGLCGFDEFKIFGITIQYFKGIKIVKLKRLKKTCTPISIGPEAYFASQTVTIVNNELDRREVKDWN